MPYTVYLKRSAEKELARLPAEIHDRVVKRLISLRDNPHPSRAKKCPVPRDTVRFVNTYISLHIP